MFIGICAFDYPALWPPGPPVKILSKLSGVLVVSAGAVLMVRRIKGKCGAGKSTSPDWLFVPPVDSTASAGFFTSSLRLTNVPPLACWTYHVLFLLSLLFYLPYSGFAYKAYRFAAMLHAAGRSSFSRTSS